jgi:alkylresorcinol/alkylpyrone synthase
MTMSILGLGTAVPQHAVSQQQATALAHATCSVNDQQRRLLDIFYRKSGVKNRFTSLPHRIAYEWFEQSNGNGTPPRGPSTFNRMKYYEDHAFPLARDAVQSAFASADIDPQEITHLVTISCTGFYAPGIDIELIRHFGLPPTAERVHVGFMGCHGAVNGLRVAHGLVAANPNAKVLVCAVELCAIHYQFQWDPERFLGNALFADGAAALVIGKTAGTSNRWQLQATGSCLIPDSADAMSWRVGDHGFEMTLAPTVPDLIGENLRPWLAQWLAQHDTSIDQIQCWAVHPGGPKILRAIEACLDLDRDALSMSRQVLAENGNMSSPTVLFLLERFISRGDQGPCVMLAFGPGLVAEAALWA